MSNSTRFNSAGFNSSTASLVLISASAAFSAGITSDFTGGGYAITAQCHMEARADSLFANGLKTSLLYADLVSMSDNNFEANATFAGFTDWQAQASNEFLATAEILAAGDLVIASTFTLNTDFKVGEANLVSGTNSFTGVANRVQFSSTAWTPSSVLTNDLDPQINGLMTGDWVASGKLWSEATVNRNLGFIAHDAYGFFDINANWANESFLTSLFTTGSFLGVNPTLEIVGTRIVPTGAITWPAGGEINVQGINTHAGEATLTHTASIEAVAVRRIYPSTGDWRTDSTTFLGKATMHRVGAWQPTTSSQLAGTTKSRLAGVLPLTNGATALFEGGRIWQKGYAPLVTQTAFTAAAEVVKPAVMYLVANIALDPKALKYSYASMDLAGFGSTITAAGALRLVDAPLARQFRVPAQNRTFIVPGKDKKFEVAA